MATFSTIGPGCGPCSDRILRGWLCARTSGTMAGTVGPIDVVVEGSSDAHTRWAKGTARIVKRSFPVARVGRRFLFIRDDFNALHNAQVWVGLGGQENRFDLSLPDDLLTSYSISFLTGASCNTGWHYWQRQPEPSNMPFGFPQSMHTATKTLQQSQLPPSLSDGAPKRSSSVAWSSDSRALGREPNSLWGLGKLGPLWIPKREIDPRLVSASSQYIGKLA